MMSCSKRYEMRMINSRERTAANANRGRLPSSKRKSPVGYRSHRMNQGPESIPGIAVPSAPGIPPNPVRYQATKAAKSPMKGWARLRVREPL